MEINPSQPHSDIEPSNDRELIDRLRAGDQTAFADIIAQLVPGLVSFSTHILGDTERATDVVQDVLARLWIDRSNLVVRTSLRAYLFTLVRNSSVNTVKHFSVVREHAVYVQQSETDERDNEESILVNSMTAEQLLQRLPARRREAVELRYKSGLSFAEIAEVMGIASPAAERLVARAVESMRKYVQGGG